MSPFLGCGSWFFFFPVRALRFSRKNFAPGCSGNHDSTYSIPCLLAWFGGRHRVGPSQARNDETRQQFLAAAAALDPGANPAAALANPATAT
jgi:hypothetical protein